MRLFFKDLRGCWKKNFWKKGKTSIENKIVAFFLVVSNITIVVEQFYMGSEVVWQVLCNYYMTISSGPKKVENQTFQQKASFPVTKDFGFIFS